MTRQECIWPLGAQLGEAPVWLAGIATLCFVDILARQVHGCAADGTQRRSWPMPRRVGFVLPLAGSEHLVVGLQGGLARFDPRSSEVRHLLDVEPGLVDNRINDGQVDGRGRLWFGTMPLNADRPSGMLYRLSARGELLPQDGPCACTNGPAFSPDGRVLYHADTMRREVHAFDVADDGSLSGKRLFRRVEHGHPDGMAVDAEGHVWIAFFGGARIERCTPQGRVVQTIAFPCDHVTKLAFGGPDLRTAFVTTACTGLSAAERADQPLAGGLFSFQVDTPGLPQHSIREGLPR